jgi:hypothetical protein
LNMASGDEKLKATSTHANFKDQELDVNFD